MSLLHTLRQSCPRFQAPDAACGSLDSGVSSPFDDGKLALVASDGRIAHCNAGILRSRCPMLELPAEDQGSLQVHEESSALQALLQWIYGEVLSEQLRDDAGAAPHLLCHRVLHLARLWGLRDADVLQARLAGQRIEMRRRTGTAVQDISCAYRAGELNLRFFFRCSGSDGEERLVNGGLTIVLCNRSQYFRAMLGGLWAESQDHSGHTVLDIQFPQEPFVRLLEFLHGSSFVITDDDLNTAVELADFFGVPSLVAHVHEWIADNLRVENATRYWRFLDEERGARYLQNSTSDDDAYVDADAACFEFHLRNFAELAGIDWTALCTPEVGSEAPEPHLHKLSVNLLKRLLMCGLITLPTKVLAKVVERYVRTHSRGRYDLYASKLLSSLLPPEVLFNQEHKSLLLGSEVSARTFVN